MKQMLESLALLNPRISFSLRDDATGKTVMHSGKHESVQGTFTQLFGLEKARHLVDVEVEEKPFKFSGL